MWELAHIYNVILDINTQLETQISHGVPIAHLMYIAESTVAKFLVNIAQLFHFKMFLQGT